MNIFGIQFDLGSFVAGIVATGVGSLLGALLINKLLLGNMVLNYLSNHADELVDKLQRRNNQIGKAVRARLIVFANKIIKELTEADGTN